MGSDSVISRVKMLVVQRRLDHSEKKLQALTVVVVALVVVTIGFLVEKIHMLI